MDRLQAGSYTGIQTMNLMTNRSTGLRSRPELSRDDLLRLKWLLGALIALTSLSSVWFFDLPGGLILGPCMLLVVAGGVRPDAVLRVPGWVWRLGFPLLAAAVIADYLVNSAVLEALLRLNVMLIVLRAVSPREKRDDLQLLVLSLILVVMAGVLTVSIGFAVLILVFTAGGLGFLLLVTLCDRVRKEGGAGDEWTRAPWRAVLARAVKVADWRFLGLAAGIFASTILMTSLLFLVIPRFEIGSSLGFMGLKNKRSLTGFTDSVAFGDVTDIKQDDSTALRVETSDPGSLPANPYWRMVVLDSYENGRFRVSRGARDGDKLTERGSFSVQGALAPAEDAAQWTFYLEPGVSRYLPLGGRFATIRLRESAEVFQNQSSNVVALSLEPQKMFAYRVDGMEFDVSIPDPGLGALAASRRVQETAPGRAGEFVGYPATLLQLAVNEQDRAVLERVATEISGGEDLPALEFAKRTLAFLWARHTYSLNSTLPPGSGDPLVRWIDSNTPGHCEYFAGAFTVIARAAGHRARVVTGFAGGTWNAFEGYYMIRNSDAHAWCEIFDGSDWVRVDPTPGAAGFASLEAPVFGALQAMDRSWRAYLDSLRVVWYRRVVNFDERQQSEVADAVKSLSRRTGEELLQFSVVIFERIEAWLRRPWEWDRILRTGLLSAAILIAVFAGWRTRSRWWGRLRLSSGGDPVRTRAGFWLSRLANAGALASEPELTFALRRLRFGPGRADRYPVELFTRARRVIRLARNGRG